MVNQETNRQSKKKSHQGLPHFFTKQLLAFLLLAFAIIVIDFFLYTFIALYESNESFHNGTPAATVRTVNAGLAATANSYELSPEASETLSKQQAWVLLLNAEGAVRWEHGAPEEIPRSYTSSEIALEVYYGNIDNYPAFFWDHTDGLLVVGFPKGTYWHMAFVFPESSMRNMPSYILLIFAIDLGILFTAYFISRRRTQRSVATIVDSLDNLSKGQSAKLTLKGDLREIGEKITDTSTVIDRKDAARSNWIQGVSHDIRTPLSLILGYADAIAKDKSIPTISDDGVGVSASELSALTLRLDHAHQQDSVAAALPHTEHGLGLVLVDRIMRSTMVLCQSSNANTPGLPSTYISLSHSNQSHQYLFTVCFQSPLPLSSATMESIIIFTDKMKGWLYGSYRACLAPTSSRTAIFRYRPGCTQGFFPPHSNWLGACYCLSHTFTN